MEDIILIDKPKGITSFDVIRRLRKQLEPTLNHAVRGRARRAKVGHAGTLDPLASGLMIIGVGPGTKKLNEYLKLPKTYEAEILIGEKRTTGDLEGEIVEECEVSELDEENVKKVLKEMIGELQLPVPAYSAIKRDGVPLYKRARKGEAVDVPIKPMLIRDAKLLSLQSVTCHSGPRPGIQDNPPGFRIKSGMTEIKKRAVARVVFDVGSGTYIRSLAEEFGKRLGYPATLQNLRRTKIGEFTIEDAEKLEV